MLTERGQQLADEMVESFKKLVYAALEQHSRSIDIRVRAKLDKPIEYRLLVDGYLVIDILGGKIKDANKER